MRGLRLYLRRRRERRTPVWRCVFDPDAPYQRPPTWHYGFFDWRRS